MNVIESLQSLGLSDKEAAVYAALLKMKKGTALSIAEAAGIKRPTAYSVLESLNEKKLVEQSRYRDVLDFHALPLENLKQYVALQKEALTEELPAVEKFYQSRQFKVRLRVYHGLEHAKVLFEKSLREKSRLTVVGDEAWFHEQLGDYWEFFMKRTRQSVGYPVFKPYKGAVALLLWSDKVAFIEQTDEPQVCGFKNKQLHDFYAKAARKL